MIYYYTFTVSVYLISIFIESAWLMSFLSVLSIGAVLLSFIRTKLLFKVIGVIFLVLGFILYFTNRQGYELEVYQYFGSMLNLLSLFLFLPFINAVIRAGKYDKTLSSILNKNTKNTYELYKKTSLITYTLGIFLNITTAVVMLNALKAPFKQIGEQETKKFASHVILRAYALILFWSPIEVLVVLSIDLTGVSYFKLLPYLLGISLLFLLFDWKIHKKKYERLPLIQEERFVDYKNVFRKLAFFSCAVVVFVSSVVFLDQALHLGFLLSVVLLVLPFSTLWALVIKKTKRYKRLSTILFVRNQDGLTNFFFIFLSAGFFVEIIKRNPYVFEPVQRFFTFIYTDSSLFVFYLIIAAFIILLSVMGFHVVVSLTLLMPFIEGMLANHALGITLTIIAASISTLMISPYNVISSLVAMSVRENPFRVLTFNIKYCLFFVFVNITVAYFLS